MPFSISEIVVCKNTEKVIALNWVYENGLGKISNQWKLSEPYGDTPLYQCTTGIMIKWLEEQLPNTQAEFDTAIANAAAQQQFAASLEPYSPHPDGPPTPITQEIEVPDLPEPTPAPEPEEQQSDSALPGKTKKGK